jgi:hypothetical protein
MSGRIVNDASVEATAATWPPSITQASAGVSHPDPRFVQRCGCGSVWCPRVRLLPGAPSPSAPPVVRRRSGSRQVHALGDSIDGDPALGVDLLNIFGRRRFEKIEDPLLVRNLRG